jgi:hypothetical protein
MGHPQINRERHERSTTRTLFSFLLFRCPAQAGHHPRGTQVPQAWEAAGGDTAAHQLGPQAAWWDAATPARARTVGLGPAKSP